MLMETPATGQSCVNADVNEELVNAAWLQLGIDPAGFLDDSVSIVVQYLAECIDSYESVLLAQFAPATFEDEVKTIKAVEALYDILVGAVEKNWCKFQAYAQRNIFIIPEGLHIPSKEDEVRKGSTITGVSEEERKLASELDDLRRKLAKEQAEFVRLRKELKAVNINIQEYKHPALALEALKVEMMANEGLVERLQCLMDRATVLRNSHAISRQQKATEAAAKLPAEVVASALRLMTSNNTVFPAGL